MSLEYNKKGKSSTNRKLLDKVQYSVKEKYGFIPTSVLTFKDDPELISFLKGIYGEGQIIEEYIDIVADLLFESLSRLENKFGRVPKSIENFSIDNEYRTYIDDNSVVKRVVPNGGVAKARGGGFATTYDYSTFNPYFAEFLLKQYFEQDMKICDPFSGRATRALMANKNKIHYHGWDVSAMTIKINENKIAELEDENHPFYDPNYEIKYFVGDGTLMTNSEPNFYDGCLTCPPYFNIEKYESNDGQLSDYKNYNDFLEHYKNVFNNVYNSIKPTTSIDNFHPFIIVTGNFRLNKLLTDFTGDTRKFAKEAGFVLYDEVHHENNSPFVYLGSRRNEARKMVAKVHETASVFIKLGEGIKNI